MVTRSTPALSDAAQMYFQSRASWTKPSTMANTKSTVNRFVAHCGSIQVGRVTPEHVESFMALLAGRLAASSLNVAAQRVSSFITFCRGRGWIKTDLTVNVRPKQVQRKEQRRLLAWEMLDLLDCADHPRDRAMMAFAMNTACRSSEIVRVRLKDLDIDRHEVELTVQKTGGSDMMPLTSDLLAELRSWLIEYQRLAGPLQGDWLLFPAKTTVHFGDTEAVLKPLQPVYAPHSVVTKALSRFGWADTKGQGFHTIRRSVARIYFDAALARGHDGALRETAALLHHAHVSTTELYLGITAERIKRDSVMKGQAFLTAVTELSQLKVVSDGTDRASSV